MRKRDSRTPAERYIDRIRNEKKQAYAIEWLAYIRSGCKGDEPSHDLSPMVAQGVRLQIGEYERDTPEAITNG